LNNFVPFRDWFVNHPCELVIVGKGYKPFPTFGCWEGNKIIQQEIEGRLGTTKSREGFVTLPNTTKNRFCSFLKTQSKIEKSLFNKK
jgi:hypothetical protein